MRTCATALLLLGMSAYCRGPALTDLALALQLQLTDRKSAMPMRIGLSPCALLCNAQNPSEVRIRQGRSCPERLVHRPPKVKRSMLLHKGILRHA